MAINKYFTPTKYCEYVLVVLNIITIVVTISFFVKDLRRWQSVINRIFVVYECTEIISHVDFLFL